MLLKDKKINYYNNVSMDITGEYNAVEGSYFADVLRSKHKTWHNYHIDLHKNKSSWTYFIYVSLKYMGSRDIELTRNTVKTKKEAQTQILYYLLQTERDCPYYFNRIDSQIKRWKRQNVELLFDKNKEFIGCRYSHTTDPNFLYYNDLQTNEEESYYLYIKRNIGFFGIVSGIEVIRNGCCTTQQTIKSKDIDECMYNLTAPSEKVNKLIALFK